MKFRYLIIDLEDGEVEGTGSRSLAIEYSATDTFIVVDVLTGMILAEDPDDVEEIFEAEDATGLQEDSD